MKTDQKNMFLAVALSAVVLFAWQFFFGPKVVPQTGTAMVQTTTPGATSLSPTKADGKVEPAPVATPAPVAQPKIADTKNLVAGEYKVILNNDFSIADMNSKGAVFPFKEISGGTIPFKVQAIQGNQVRNLFFNFSQTSPSSIKGVDTELGVKLMASLSAETGRLSFNLTSSQPLAYRFVLNSKAESLDNNQIRQFLYFGKEVERINVGDDHVSDAKVRWFGLDFNYHLIAVVLGEKATSKMTVTEAGRYTIDTLQANNQFKGDLVFAKKNYDALVKMGDNLELSVDFGIFGILAVPILRGLQFFYDFIPNYGIAIILLTLLIRMITFPLQYKSFKSMKKMQVVQPELQKLKEKYKDDPQRMQRETMELFKRAGANPLGGCLPMLLQMPVFFAFYQVLYNSVELVQAPFAFWIIDLSIKDPYYVLPVLMGLAMFGQTKLNPSTTADPTQQKVMLFMPLIFCFIMKDLPAGLNLYIFVSTIFGIVQQLFVYKTTD